MESMNCHGFRRYWEHDAEDCENHPEILCKQAYMQYRSMYNVLASQALERGIYRYSLRPKMHQLEHLQPSLKSIRLVCPVDFHVSCMHKGPHTYISNPGFWTGFLKPGIPASTVVSSMRISTASASSTHACMIHS